MFFPPELAGADEDMEEALGNALGAKTELMRRLYTERNRATVRDEVSDRKLVRLVLDHARKVIAHPSRPTRKRLAPYLMHPMEELDLEETLDESPLMSVAGAEAEGMVVELSEEKAFSCVTMLDCSSSMSGEKHLLASIAVAVLLLEVAPRDASLSVFASKAVTMKGLGSEEAAEETVLRFLRSVPRGFTNIASGLEEGLRQFRIGGRRKRNVGLIATDGRTTEGKDPVDVARKFDYLVVLHLHGPGSHIEASKQMAQAGHGICLEVEKFEELPQRLYDALRMLARL